MSQIKTTLIIFSLLFCIAAGAQEIGDQYHSWSFSYGRTGTPGDQLKAGLEYAQSAKFSYYLEPSVEWSKYQGLNYTCFGIAAGGRYYLVGGNDMRIDKKINLLVGFSGVLQGENDKYILNRKTFLEKLNYGLAGQLVGEYYYNPTTGFFVGIEQKYLFNKTLGNTNYSVFAGLKIHFGN